jgi:hypothetical protein
VPGPKGLDPFGTRHRKPLGDGTIGYVTVTGDDTLSPEPLNSQGADMSEEVSVWDKCSAVVY